MSDLAKAPEVDTEAVLKAVLEGFQQGEKDFGVKVRIAMNLIIS